MTSKWIMAILAPLWLIAAANGASDLKDVSPPVNGAKHVSGDWDWMPQWRERGDCGPQALFALMKLQGLVITMNDIKHHITVDPERGCSLADLHQAALALGMPAEMRFVNPNSLKEVPRPFILHGVTSIEKGLGHFAIVVDYDPVKESFALINPIFESFGWWPEKSVLNGFSGYVLVPTHPVSQNGWRLAGWSMVIAGIGGLTFWWVCARRMKCKIVSDASFIPEKPTNA